MRADPSNPKSFAYGIIVTRLAATALAVLALYWAYVFGITDFRPQWRVLYLCFAGALFVIACGLWLKARWAYVVSMVLATLGFVFTCVMLVGAPANIALWLQAVVLAAYGSTVAGLLYRWTRKGGRIGSD